MFFLLFGDAANSNVAESWKGITDPVTNIGALAILGIFLLKVVPMLVTMIVKALGDRDDKFAKVIDTIQVKQDERNLALTQSVAAQTTALTASWERGFGDLKGAVLSACKGRP